MQRVSLKLKVALKLSQVISCLCRSYNHSAVVKGGSSGAIAPLDFHKFPHEPLKFRKFRNYIKSFYKNVKKTTLLH